MKKIKIGVVPYMNAKPLIYGMGNNKNVVELHFKVPALLSEMLKRGEIDVALVPSIEYFRGEKLSASGGCFSQFLIIPNIAIASNGEVKSVRLFVKNHTENIKTVALDRASMTSCVLLRIIMSEKYHLIPAFIPWDPSEEGLNSQADAFLMIGDNALKTNGENYFTIDLGKEWQDMTHLPFVYAFWATKRETKIPGLKDILQEAKAKGLRKLEELAVIEAKRLGLTINECLDYLSKNIYYDLGEKELGGLRTFYKYAVKMGLVKEGIDIEFYNA